MIKQLNVDYNLKLIGGIIKLIRVKQWVKNTFVMAPLIFSGAFFNQSSCIQTLLVMLLFCFASSVVYVINDLMDVENDKKHPIKSKKRPLASGQLKEHHAMMCIGFLILFTIYLQFKIINNYAVLVVFGYIALNLLYTFKLKHMPVLDIFTIAIGFVLRVYSGSLAINVPISFNAQNLCKYLTITIC